MGIGLTVTIGYAGLLDLGYVAFFAIGAYSVGILTTPSLITCGGINPSEIARENIATTCTGLLTFWQAWPLSVLVAGCAGLLLGIPILRLRGDYLAIVTLGFGEIIRLIALSNTFSPLLGGAQGIANIPFPVLDLTAESCLADRPGRRHQHLLCDPGKRDGGCLCGYTVGRHSPGPRLEGNAR